MKKEYPMKRLRTWSILMAATALLLITTTIASAGGANPGVLPPGSRVQGLTYGEWLAKWWQYGLSIPAPQNPMTGMTGANCIFQRIGNMALAIVSPLSSEPIKCEVPSGTMLFLEIVSAECSTLEPPPFYGGNEEELRACAQNFIPEALTASIDGREVRNLSEYIVTSPLYEFTVPEDNILGAPADATGKSVAHGAFLMLAPFTSGKHTIHLHGEYPEYGYIADRNFDLTVTH
jgi:hypothetical protein